jgi:hypothetical protein
MEWLHFCDFHIGGPRGPQAEVLRSLIDQVKLVCARGSGKIDAVFLVGDIAYSGKAAEYQRFADDFLTPLLQIPSVAGAKVFGVPGNHDVDCDKALPITWESIQKRNQELFFCEDDEGRKVRKFRASVFEDYWAFVLKNNIISPNPLEQVSIFYSDESLPCDIIAINTAFFSDRSEDSSKQSTPVPLSSIRSLIKTGQSSKPFLILGHHSPSSFLLDHERQFKTLLVDKKAVLLHGHEHDAKACFNADGTLRTLGFGATYLTPLGSRAESPYVNSFTHCKLSDQLCIVSNSWNPSVGRWVDMTEIQFSDCLVGSQYNGQVCVRIPIVSNNIEVRNNVLISSIPRSKAKPSKLIPLDGPNEEVWMQIIRLSDNIRVIIQKGDFVTRQLPQENEKTYFVLESADRRDLLVCIAGINHVLSSKEIESFNTRLDTDDYASVTIISLGKITDEAYGMYVRLKSKKPIEVLVNKQLTADADKFLSVEQNIAITKLDSARHSVNVLLGKSEVHILVIDQSEIGTSFYIMQRDGTCLLSSSPLVTALRLRQPEFATMNYLGDAANTVGKKAVHFDRVAYLNACYKEYNVIKYAALANVGIRFSDLPLEELYVNATASDVDDGSTNRLEDVVSDHLANYPMSDALKAHIKKQLLSSVQGEGHQETSKAREFCQKYGAVLVTGDPGSGKTCFVKNEILAYCDNGKKPENTGSNTVENWYSSHLPIMLQLSELVAENDLEEKGLFVVTSRLLARRGFLFPESEIENYTKNGRVAWFFDGLDEVVSVEKRAIVVQHINQLVSQFLPIGNRIIVTSRPAAIHVVNLLPTLHKLEIQGFTHVEIRTLAERILRVKLADSADGLVLDEGEVAKGHEQLIDQLISDCQVNPGVARLAQNPLLLTLLIMIYANSGAPSAKRHRIYEQAIQTLASVRGREAGHSPISAQDLRERLGAVALSVYKKESGLLPSRNEVCEVVKSVMSRQRGENVSVADASAFIQKVAESTGLIAVENRQGESSEAAIVTFMHHSFLEYFAAIGLSRDLENFDINKLVTQPRWHEILTLLSGIIGENEDVAPILAKFLESGDGVDTDAKLLLFAMDCALECEVPSDAAQRLLGKAIKSCILTGPARIDPWVRSEIGQRLAQLFKVCGGGEFDDIISSLINDPDKDISAASISMVGYACTSGYESGSVLTAFNKACERIEEPVLCAICTAAGRSKVLRTAAALQVISKCLTKTQRCKRAAFEAIGYIPSLASNYWGEIINGIDDKNSSTSRFASMAALHAGLNADLITLSGSRKDILLRALKCVDDLGSGFEDHPPQIKRETIERMLASAYSKDRTIAIQVLPMTDGGEQYIYDELFGILRGDSDREDVVAALIALRGSGPVLFLLNQDDLKRIVHWFEVGTSDVRVAAIRLLGCFGGDLAAVEALRSKDYRNFNTDEYCSCVHALSNARVLADSIAPFLFSELEYYLSEKRTMNSDANRRLKSVLDSLKRLGKTGPATLVNKVRALVDDYRINKEIKPFALLCYAAIAMPSRQTVENVTKLFTRPPIGMDYELAQVPSIIAKQCRQSVEYVVACIDALTQMRVAMTDHHKKLMRREPSDESELCVTELRRGIDDITQIIVAFNEFIENGKSTNKS